MKFPNEKQFLNPDQSQTEVLGPGTNAFKTNPTMDDDDVKNAYVIQKFVMTT